MKAYNTPKDELHIESDTGETLVSITSEKTTIANLEGGGSNVVANPSPAGSTKLTGLQIDDTKYKVFSTANEGKTGYGLVYADDNSAFWQPISHKYTFENSYIGVNKVWNASDDKSVFQESVMGLSYSLPYITFDGSDNAGTRGSLTFGYSSGGTAYFYGVLIQSGTLKMAQAAVSYDDEHNVLIATLTFNP